MSGRKCQFPGIIQDAIAAMLVIGEEQVVAWIEAEASKVGIITEEGQEL